MHPHTRYSAKLRQGLTALSLLLALSAAAQTGTVYTATWNSPVVINDPSTLVPGDSIVFGENYSAVVVNQGLSSSFVNFLTPVSAQETGVLVFGATNTTTADLDFTGKGRVALAGVYSAEGMGSLAGHWTPDGDEYLVVDNQGTGGAGTYSFLRLSGTNVLTDGATARSLFVSVGNLFVDAANSFSGGTTVAYGMISVGATGALGSGTVTVRDGGWLDVGGAGVSLSNTVELRPSSSYPAPSVTVWFGGTLASTVRVFGREDTGSPLVDVPAIQVSDGTFSGRLEAYGAGRLALHDNGLITASIMLQAGAGFDIWIEGGQLRSALTVTAGNRLIAETGSARLPLAEAWQVNVWPPSVILRPTVFNNLTFTAGATFVTNGRDAGLGLGGTANVYLNGANFDAAYSWGFEGVTDNVILIDGWNSLLGTSQLLISTENGQIYGTLNAINVLSGYGVQFTLLENSTQLWATVYETTTAGSAIPEPSTYAALAGVGVLGVAVWRRRGRGARTEVDTSRE